MPIEVHCPNPECARVHLVKDKYAGMRGKCPLCQSWMYIPKPAQVPTRTAPATMHSIPDPVASWPEEAEPARQPSPPVKPMAKLREAPPEPAVEEEVSPPKRQPERSSPKRTAAKPEPEPEVDAIAVAEEDEPDAEKAKPKPHFSYFAVILLLLGILSLGAMATAPFLEGPKKLPPGLNLPQPGGVSPELALYVSGAAGVVAFLALLSLLMAFISRRMGVASLLFLYLAVLGSSALLFLGLHWHKTGEKVKTQTEVKLGQRRVEGKISQDVYNQAVPISLGMQPLVLAFAPLAACGFLVLAALFMHRALWAKLLAFLFLGFLPALMGAWVYHEELGLKDNPFPIEIPMSVLR